MIHEELTSSILGAFYEVHRGLGHGFLESVYERAMVIALGDRSLGVVRHQPIQVHFNGKRVGDFFPDLFVENLVMVEIKACASILPVHAAQVLNYLRATSAEVGLLLLFGPKAAFRRLVFTNDRKSSAARPTCDSMGTLVVDER